MQETVFIIPEDQAKLEPEQLEDDETCILRASDPNAPDNVSVFSFENSCFKMQPNVSQLAHHYDLTTACVAPPRPSVRLLLTRHRSKLLPCSISLIMHRESQDAKNQLAMEAQIVAKEKEVLRELEEAAMKEGDGRDPDEVVEDASALRNQFNFSDRTYQTVIHPRRCVRACVVGGQPADRV